MLLEYSIADIKSVYEEDMEYKGYSNYGGDDNDNGGGSGGGNGDDNDNGGGDDSGNGDDGKSREADYDNIAYMENIVSEEIDKYNISSSIIHIFPITISLSVLVLLSSYIILY